MTVGTTHFALGDLFLDGRERVTLAHQICYSLLLVSAHVVKLKNYGICLTTIDARMRAQVVPDVLAGGLSRSLFVLPNSGDVVLFVSSVPVFALLGLARLTGSPPDSSLLITEVKVVFRFEPSTGSALLHLGSPDTCWRFESERAPCYRGSFQWAMRDSNPRPSD